MHKAGGDRAARRGRADPAGGFLGPMGALADYFWRMVARRRGAPGEDVFSMLLRADDQGDTLTDLELVANAVLFVTALGTDDIGDRALEDLKAEVIDLRFVRRITEAPSGIALILVDERGENVIAVAGFSILQGTASPNGAMVVATLAPWADRETPELQLNAILARLRATFATIPGANVAVFAPPAISGIGAVGVAILGIPTGEIPIDVNEIVFKMLTLRGIYGREMYETWYQMTVLLQSGLDITPVITHRFSFRDHDEAFATAGSGQSGKIVMSWEDA